MDVLELLNRYVFLGQEFLTWLWFAAETEGCAVLLDGRRAELFLGERLVLGPAQGQEGQRITFSGHDNSYAEAKEALRRGKLVEAMRLGMELEGEEYWLSLRASDLGLGSMRLPAAAPQEDEGPEGLILERIYLVEAVVKAVEGLFATFLVQRADAQAGPDLLAAMRAWAHRED